MHHMSRPFIRPVPMTEQALQRQCLDFLRLKYGSRAFVRKVPVGPMMVQPRPGEVAHAKNPLAGFPDILICLGGKFIGIEVKLPGGRISPIQAITHDAIREAGGIVHVIHSLDELMQAFEGIR